MSANSALEKWIQSADAWIADQGTEGDWARRAVLDPALEKLLTNTKGKAVLDLGCGEGRYSRILQDNGALVTGIDPVPQFIERARSLDPMSTYVEGTAEDLPFESTSFDIVLSYLTFIDIADLQAASQEIARVLRPGGELIVVSISNMASTTEGWIKDAAGNKAYRKVDRYMEHFAMDLEWRGIRIKNYHRPLSYIFGLFLNHGFVLTRFIEPLPDLSDPYYNEEWRVPNFQIYSFKRTTE
ncbi:class I SAM-dependent methyltransferase [Leptothoe spongobia]|uniref:Class I SAM-dependent methyltransferase n=1 Tax=Leptothoe spongobia TAU-MAC 1115 TaxID=1967444 RepID=A0A947DHV2_9CYAN|nr:class I SAM-dependent methyltransferase [Leptothoe spongobia]MBT9316206.1 class I SAM-dependent methyltransferase [Leptothoe spongobia TAU-MAC 1115]